MWLLLSFLFVLVFAERASSLDESKTTQLQPRRAQSKMQKKCLPDTYQTHHTKQQNNPSPLADGLEKMSPIWARCGRE